MNGWLIHHQPREISKFDDITVYYDSISNNQDPYVWNIRFLHSFCQIPKVRGAEPGDIIFWVARGEGETIKSFNHLYCDLVFVIDEKILWKQTNNIDQSDPMVDTREAFFDHYRWWSDHIYKENQKRITFKACPEKSFQPQNNKQELIDIVPILQKNGYTIEELQKNMQAGFNTQPIKLRKDVVKNIYNNIYDIASIKLKGALLQKIRKNNPSLKSKNNSSDCGC